MLGPARSSAGELATGRGLTGYGLRVEIRQRGSACQLALAIGYGWFAPCRPLLVVRVPAGRGQKSFKFEWFFCAAAVGVSTFGGATPFNIERL